MSEKQDQRAIGLRASPRYKIILRDARCSVPQMLLAGVQSSLRFQRAGHIDSKVGPIDISEGVAMLRMLGKAR